MIFNQSLYELDVLDKNHNFVGNKDKNNGVDGDTFHICFPCRGHYIFPTTLFIEDEYIGTFVYTCFYTNTSICTCVQMLRFTCVCMYIYT